MAIVLNKTSFLDAPIQVESIHGVTFSSENKGHQFVISCMRGGSLVPLTGTVTAKFMRSNNTTILLAGSGYTGIVDGKATVTLHQDCYNIPGRFQLAIFLTENGETSCIYACVGMVQRTQNGELIDSGDVVPSLEELLEKIQDCEDATTAANAAAANATSAAQSGVRTDTDAQGLTDTQKVNARTNISAASAEEVSNLKTAFDNRFTDNFDNAVYEQLRQSDIVQGKWSSGAIKGDDPKRICVKELIPVEVGDRLIIGSNPDELYYYIGIYETGTSTSLYSVSWTKTANKEYPINYNGDLFIQFGTAATYDGSSDILPSDFTTEVKLVKGKLFREIYDMSETVESHDRIAENYYEKLYIPAFIQGRMKEDGMHDNTDSYYNYRISSSEVVALPYSPNRKLCIKINPKYLVTFRTGAVSRNLNHVPSPGWLGNGDELTLQSNDNYYRIGVCNAQGDVNHNSVQIAYTEDIGLEITMKVSNELVVKNKECTRLSNGDSEKVLTAARLKTFSSASTGNNITTNPVIAHTSDCHGDYKRVQNFFDFCDQLNIDAACVTGDMVSYIPDNGIAWFNEIVNKASCLPAVCVGNHDVYNDSLDDDDIYDMFFADIATKIGNATGKTWYYKDITAKKIRIISINLYQYGGESRWYSHFTSEQLDFLISTLSSTPNDYGIIILSHSPQASLENARDSNYGDFFQVGHVSYSMHNAVSGGVPIYDIVDAFISRTTISKTYTQTGSPSSVSVSADFSSVDASVEFIAHLTGHLHADQICYTPGTANKQLMLNVTCTNALYGGSDYPYLADISDIGRNKNDATGDAFNVYVIDRENKTVKVIRVGGNLTNAMEERKYMVIPYADS